MSLRCRALCASLLCCLALVARSQSAKDSSALKLSGYAEVYFSYDLSRPSNNERPDFLYNHKRTSEVAVNLALLKAEYARDRVRATVGLMAGTYVQYNLASEPSGLKQLYEATVGVRLSRTRDLWLDAGIFPSHIGAEGVIGADCLTLTRSLMAENSPFFESGAKLTYRPNARWMLVGLLLNGWQQIQRPDGWTKLAFGTQLQYTDGSGTTLNWSTYAGSWGPDSLGTMRIYNDLHATVKGEGYATNVGCDIGLQQAFPGAVWDGWFSVMAVHRQRVVRHWWAVGRMEYFLDDMSVIIPEANLLGASLGVDLELAPNVLWRVEGRLLGDTQDRFVNASGAPSPTNTAFTTALCARF